MAVHVFWDNSNIWISLQSYCSSLEGVPPAAVRVNLRNLDDYVVRGRKTGKKVIAGSYPPESEEIVQIAQQLGYNTQFLHRVDINNQVREQGVDMYLQLQMSMALNQGHEKEVMVVLTGDSNVDPDSNTSFLEIIQMALQKKWDVEVYAVKECLSKRNYESLLERYGSSLQIEYLNDIYREISFIKEGDFYFPEDPTTIVHVENRRTEAKSW